MRLRAKTFIAMASTLLVLVALQYALVNEIVEGGFAKVLDASDKAFARIEDEEARRNVTRVRDAISYRIDTLATKVADWSKWDDTYRYVKDRNRAYEESNLGEDAPATLRMNILMIVDEKGRIVYQTAFDLGTGKIAKVPKSLAPYVAAGGLLSSHSRGDSVTKGILSLPEGPLMVASRPIVKSTGEGPIRGVVLFGRFLDGNELEELGRITHLRVETSYLPKGGSDSEFTQVQPALSSGEQVVITQQSDSLLHGYTAMEDLEKATRLLLRVDLDREIHRQSLATNQDIQRRGRVILTSILLGLVITGIVVCLVTAYLIERWILSRLTGLSRKAEEIGRSQDFSARVEAGGKDEIHGLGVSVNSMLEALEEDHLAIETHNARMRLLMDTVPAGLLSLDETFRVNPDYSHVAETYFDVGRLDGRRFVELLGLTGRSANEGRSLEEFFGVMMNELIPWESMAGLNPMPEFEIVQGGHSRWLKLAYYLIRRGNGRPNHLLCVLADITEEKRLAEEVGRSERENLQLKAIAEDPELFREFITEAAGILKAAGAALRELDCTEAGRPLVNDIFRGIHTLKGVAVSFGLLRLSFAAGELETALEPLRWDATAMEPLMIVGVARKLKELEDCFDEAWRSARRIFGEELDFSGGMVLRVSSEDISRHIAEVSALDAGDGDCAEIVSALREDMVARLASLRQVPARRGLARAFKIVPGLMERLGKQAAFEVHGEEVLLDCDMARELNTPLIHLIRNALDHGLEGPADRLKASKPAEGLVSLTISRDGSGVRLVLADDGNGLDSGRLKARAVEARLVTAEQAEAMTEEEAWGLIFRPGFTTAREVSDVSGRGVGMDAVARSIIDNLGGRIELHSVSGAGTTFTLHLPAAGTAGLLYADGLHRIEP